MIELKKILKRLRQTMIITGLLASLVWLQGLWISPVQAMPNTNSPYTHTQPRILDDESAKQALSDRYRYQVVLNCIPEELGNVNNDTQERIERALSELGNDQLERAFDLTDDPQLSNAELEFEQCLQSNGIIPQRKLQSFLGNFSD